MTDITDVWKPKDFPESEPLANMIGKKIGIVEVKTYPSRFGLMAVVRLDDQKYYRTTSDVLVEQLMFVKDYHITEQRTVYAKLVTKHSGSGNYYMVLETAKE